MDKAYEILENVIERYPVLNKCRDDIISAYEALVTCYKGGGKILICGNGGSAADSEHIVGELMKGFLKRRELSSEVQQVLKSVHPEWGKYLAENLQGALPAIALTTHTALGTAFSNDVDADLIYAQQTLGYGKRGDVIIGLSTSGNAKNVLYALYTGKAAGLTTIGLTGRAGGKMKEVCDILICVPEAETPNVQELHLPVYHALCAMTEQFFFDR